MRLGNILQAHGNNSVHGIHLPIARVCFSTGPRNGRNQMGKVAALLVKSGTLEQHHSGIRNTKTPKILNLLKIRGKKLPGVVKFSCRKSYSVKVKHAF
jgi:hypothetical protein